RTAILLPADQARALGDVGCVLRARQRDGRRLQCSGEAHKQQSASKQCVHSRLANDLPPILAGRRIRTEDWQPARAWLRCDIEQASRMRYGTTLLLGSLTWSALAGAQELRRATIWDLKLGQPIAAQPAAGELGAFACGANGGPPRQPLTGWSDFMRCADEPGGLREVYFEYDDEYEFVARARNLPREVARWAGTTEVGFPVMTSALFDDAGVL